MNNAFVVPLVVGGTLVLMLFAFALLVYFWVQKNKHYHYQLEHDRLRSAILKENERTMTEIAADIHDNVSQIVAHAHFNIKSVLDFAETREEVVQALKRASELLTEAGNDLQNISHSLSAEYIKDRGLMDVITKQVEYINGAGKMSATLEVEGKYIRLDPEKELLIYRIVQEAMHNAMKHSGGKELRIHFNYGDTIVVTIADDGKGFQNDRVSLAQGIGVTNMSNRASLLKADLGIISNPDGVKVTLTYPR